MTICITCGFDFYNSRPDKKYCNSECYDKNRGIFLICKICAKEFKGRSHRLYCSMKCAGMSKREALIKRNTEKRKYPEIENLSRSQVYKRLNPESTINYNFREQSKRLKVIDYLGGKCAHCNYDKDIRALVLDHINSDGKQDRLRLGSRISRYYVNNLEEAKLKLQVLCSNCNLIKSFECKEHNTSRRVIKKIRK